MPFLSYFSNECTMTIVRFQTYCRFMRTGIWLTTVFQMVHSDAAEEASVRLARYLFGWWDRNTEFGDELFEIRPVQRFTQAVDEVRRAGSLGPEWFHPPVEHSSTEGVDLPCERFALPVTHCLTVTGHAYDADQGDFLVLVLGFCLGLKLTPQGTGHLMATPWKERTLSPFYADKRDILVVLRHALNFWLSQPPEVRSLAFSAIHWHLTAHSYRQQHERFAWQYTVMDNIYRLACLTDPAFGSLNNRNPHGRRPGVLGQKYGSPMPTAFGAGDATVLSGLRNELIHEARWCGEPIGYSVSTTGHDLVHALQYYNAQLILGFLDVRCRFRQMSDPMQLQALDIY